MENIMACILHKIFKYSESPSIAKARSGKWRKAYQFYDENGVEPPSKSIRSMVKMKRWTTSTLTGDHASEPDYQSQSNLFTNESIPKSGYDGVTDEKMRFIEGRLAFWIPISITFCAVLLICLLVLWFELRRDCFPQPEQHVGRELEMVRVSRPLQNLIPRPSTLSTVRITSPENPDSGNPQNNPATEQNPSEGQAAGEQEAPKEFKVTSVKFEVDRKANLTLQLDEAKEQNLDMASGSTGATCGMENNNGENLGKGMEEKAADGKDGDGFPNEIFLKEQKPRAFSASV